MTDADLKAIETRYTACSSRHQDISTLILEVRRLRELLNGLHCSFCGANVQATSREEAQREMAEHIAGCEKHPLRAATLRVLELEAANLQLREDAVGDGECLNMIHARLKALGCACGPAAHNATPPMCYDDWITCAVLSRTQPLEQEVARLQLENGALHEQAARLQEELSKLHQAITESGYGVLRASNGWSIHDVSDRQAVEDRKTRDVIAENIELQQEVRRLVHRLEKEVISEDDEDPQLRQVDLSALDSVSTCDHGVTFDKVLAAGLSAAEVQRRWPRLSGLCPKGCGYCGIAYASEEHYHIGDW